MSLFILILKVFVECVPLSYNKFQKIMILHVQKVTRLLNNLLDSHMFSPRFSYKTLKPGLNYKPGLNDKN